MTSVTSKDYYGKNPYAAYNHADRPLIKIRNRLNTDGKKLMVIHDSFSNCVIPFLALAIHDVDAIDLRHFTGSLKRYIEENKPDVLAVMYTPSQINAEQNYNTHKYQYDFR